MNIREKVQFQIIKRRMINTNRKKSGDVKKFKEYLAQGAVLSQEEMMIILPRLDNEYIINILNMGMEYIVINEQCRKKLLEKFPPLEQLKLVNNLTEEEKRNAISNIKYSKYSDDVSKFCDYLKDFDNDEAMKMLEYLNDDVKIDIITNKKVNLYYCVELMKDLPDVKKTELLNDSKDLSVAQKAQIVLTMDIKMQKEMLLKMIDLSPEIEYNLLSNMPKEDMIDCLGQMDSISRYTLHNLVKLPKEEKIEIMTVIKNLQDKSILAGSLPRESEYDEKKLTYYKNYTADFELDNIEKILENFCEHIDDKTILQEISTLSYEYDGIKTRMMDGLLKRIKENKIEEDYMVSACDAMIDLALGLSSEEKSKYILKINKLVNRDMLLRSINKKMKVINRDKSHGISQDRGILTEYNVDELLGVLYSPEEKKKKMEILEVLKKENDDIESTINFDFLDEKYMYLFKDKTNIITRNFDFQKHIVSLNDEKMHVLSNLFSIISNDKNWNEYLSRVVMALENNGYSKLVSEIANSEKEIDYRKILNIIICDSKNSFNIESFNDVENYAQIRKEKCKLIISGKNANLPDIEKINSLDRKKFAYLERIYGHDIETAQRIVKQYGKNIEEIKDENLKVYVKSLKSILEEQDESKIDLLEQVQGIDEENLDQVAIESKLKLEFGKLFNDTLFRIDSNSVKYQGNEFGNIGDIYVAGKNDSLMTHGIDACIGQSSESGLRISNYYDYWNRNSFGGNMCCALVKKGMENRAIDNGSSIYFGFLDMEEELLLMGASDIGTLPNDEYNRPKSHIYPEFLAPETIQNYHVRTDHSEFVYSPYVNEKDSNGISKRVKKQPDYIVVRKKDKKIIDDIGTVLQAKKDFEERKIKMPIVVKEDTEEREKKTEEITIDEIQENYEFEKGKSIKNQMVYSRLHNLASHVQTTFKESEKLEHEPTEEEER